MSKSCEIFGVNFSTCQEESTWNYGGANLGNLRFKFSVFWGETFFSTRARLIIVIGHTFSETNRRSGFQLLWLFLISQPYWACFWCLSLQKAENDCKAPPWPTNPKRRKKRTWQDSRKENALKSPKISLKIRDIWGDFYGRHTYFLLKIWVLNWRFLLPRVEVAIGALQ